MSDVIMIVGYPASGKSTVSKKYIDIGHHLLNRDTEGGTIADLVPKMTDLLEQGKNVVLDNTFPTKEVRQQFIVAAKSQDAAIHCILLKTTIEEAQFNACARMIERTGKLLSPDEIKKAKSPNFFPPTVQYKYRKQFEIPAMDEGFATFASEPFKRTFPKSWVNKAIFLDYDGTLRETKSDSKWPSDPNDIVIRKNGKEVLDFYKGDGYILLGVSNQSGIADGSPTMDQAVACFERTNARLGHNIEYSFCPHKVPPIGCYCRKPLAGMAIEFFYKHKLDPRQCIMVGDMTSDKTFAKRACMEFVHADKFFC